MSILESHFVQGSLETDPRLRHHVRRRMRQTSQSTSRFTVIILHVAGESNKAVAGRAEDWICVHGWLEMGGRPATRNGTSKRVCHREVRPSAMDVDDGGEMKERRLGAPSVKYTDGR
jgi:hypothetical protein